MRTACLLAMTCLTACDQLVSSDSTWDNEPGPTSQGEIPTTPGVRWTTSHDGVLLSSQGVVPLAPDGGKPIDVLHVRVVVLSHPETITVNASAASLELSTRRVVSPIAVNAATPRLPLATIDSSGSQTFDLFFPLPERAGTSVAFSWSLGIASGRVPLRAVIQVDGNPTRDRGALAGERWWFATGYAWPTFRRQDGIITARPPSGASVTGFRDPDDDRASPCDQW